MTWAKRCSVSGNKYLSRISRSRRCLPSNAEIKSRFELMSFALLMTDETNRERQSRLTALSVSWSNCKTRKYIHIGLQVGSTCHSECKIPQSIVAVPCFPLFSIYSLSWPHDSGGKSPCSFASLDCLRCIETWPGRNNLIVVSPLSPEAMPISNKAIILPASSVMRISTTGL